MMSLATMIERFDVERLSVAGPVFDIAKLDWLNARYIRETLDLDAFMQRVAEWGFTPEYLRAIASLAQSRIERLSDLSLLAAFLFAGVLPVTAEQLRDGRVGEPLLRRCLALGSAALDALPEWNKAGIERAMRWLSERLGLKLRDFVRPFYVAITGSPASLPLFDSMELLGRDLCRERLRHALVQLGGVSERELKSWSREIGAMDAAS
jgi:glutamyl-tRNA synthetase